MPLTAGTRLGSYEITDSLGAGGMGEVYRARDTKLDRDVALKNLPETLASDPDRLMRFEREAKTLASLNHPHIAQIYGFEQAGLISALAMELVEGEDLSHRIARGAIPIDEARDARFELDDAHGASDAVVANTAVRRKAMAGIAVLAVVMSIAAIVTWAWIGTRTRAPARDSATWIAAMLALDVPDLSALTDRFAVAPDGSALVVVGPGGGLSLRRRTALDATPIAGVPPGAFSPVFSPDGKWIAFATDGALMKIPTEGGSPAIITRGADYFVNLTWGQDDRIRFPTSSWNAVRSVASAGGSVESIAFEPGVRVRRAEALPDGRMLVSLAAGSTMSIAVREADGTQRVIAEGWDARLTPTGHLVYARPEGATWSLVATPFDKRTASLEGEPVVIARDIAVHYAASAGVTSPGDLFFIAGKARSDRRVVVLNRAGGERDVALPPGAWVATVPSPDGQMLAIGRWEGARRTIWTVSLATGALTKVTYAEDTFHPRWMPDGKRLLFTHFPLSPQATATSMWSVSTDGRGQIEAIPAELDAYPMSVTSDGRTLYYRVYRANQEQSDIYTLALDAPTAAPAPVLTTPSSEDWPIPSPNHRWLAYATNASGAEETRVARRDALSDVVQVSARGGRPVSWSPDGGRLYYTDGDTVSVVDVNASGGAVYFAISPAGVLAYAPAGLHDLVLVTRDGTATPISDERGALRMPRLSPDGRHVATVIDSETRRPDIWLFDVQRGMKIRLTTEGAMMPTWSSDGKRVTFNGLREKPADGSGSTTALAKSNDWYPTAWSRDGRHLLFNDVSAAVAAGNGDIWVLADGTPQPLLTTTASEYHAQFSPDGRWIAYQANVSGKYEVYATRYPGLEGRVVVSSGGGTNPVWSRDGTEIYYRRGSALMAASFDVAHGALKDQPRQLFDGPFVGAGGEGQFDVTADGRFVMTRGDDAAVGRQINVVFNWIEELKSKQQ